MTTPPPPDVESAPPEARPPSAPRRLLRSTSDRMLGGVAGGLSDYTGIDPVLMRLAFVVLAIVTAGLCVVFYFAAWVIMPEDEAAAEGGALTGSRAGSAAGIVLGALLIAVGLIWLLGELDLEVPRFDVILAAALILVGAALLVAGARGGSAGLVVLGVMLTLALGAASAIDVSFDGGFGERNERPGSVADLDRDYSHAFGSMTLDLRDVEFPAGTTRLDVAVAFGEVRVDVPADVGLRVEADTVFGSSQVLDRESSGVAANRTFQSSNYSTAEARLDIELSVAFGSAQVDTRR